MEKLYTPKDLVEKKILSLAQQWKERKKGRLKCYRIGRKILYAEQHVADYLALCESVEINLEAGPESFLIKEGDMWRIG